jgi:hypothetical protein
MGPYYGGEQWNRTMPLQNGVTDRMSRPATDTPRIVFGSAFRIRTEDLTIMSDMLLPTELMRQNSWRSRSDSNRH